MNLYAHLGTFQARYADNQALDTTDQAGILSVLEAASRRCDHVTDRHFYAVTETRYFDGNGQREMLLPDLLAVTTAKLDEDGDRTFEVTLAAATDYYLERAHHYDMNGASPKTRIRLDWVNGSKGAFLARPRLLEIAGRWGFTEETEAVTSLANEALDDSETGFDVDAGTDFAVGQTILVDTEQMYITAIATNTLTVVRGVNGTTAATHANDVAIRRYVYVPNVREATLILASRMWKRRDTAYANVIANPVVGTFETFRRTDPDAAELLEPYIRGDSLV